MARHWTEEHGCIEDQREVRLNGRRFKRVPAPPITNHRPVGERTFEELAQSFNRYMEHIAKDTENESKLYTWEDTKQEMLIALWKCYSKYPHLRENEFRAVFITSLNNRLAGIFRRKFVTKDLKDDHIDNPDIRDRLPHGEEVGDAFFNESIGRLRREMSEESREVLDRALTQKVNPSDPKVAEAIREAEYLL